VIASVPSKLHVAPLKFSLKVWYHTLVYKEVKTQLMWQAERRVVVVQVITFFFGVRSLELIVCRKVAAVGISTLRAFS